MDIRAVFSCDPETQYKCVVGTTFTDEYTETLDSASVIIAHVASGALIKNIEPYNFVYVFDNDNSSFKRYYLVDTFDETYENYTLGIKQYTISLMSMTKFLEKIQLPSRSVRHIVNADGTITYKKISQVINEAMLIYCPKVKKTENGSTWDYEYLFSWGGADFNNKFNVDCKDFALSQPTLRTFITVCMSQVGCIPRMDGFKLSYLDLRAENAQFSVGSHELIKSERSMSSDSYLNTLVNMGQNILDTENYVYSENIGFRDKDSVLLKQKENLYLNTTFPIYSVKKLTMNAYMNGELHFMNMVHLSAETQTENISLNAGVLMTINDATHGTYFGFATLAGHTYKNIKVDLLKSRSDGVGYIKVSSISFSDFTSESGEYHYQYNINTGSYVFDEIAVSVDEYNPTLAITANGYFATWIGNGTGTISEYTDLNVYFDFSYDISPLCVENSKRNLLETNYLTMTDVDNIDDLAKYIYGTVGYKIGDTQITGFSQTYSKAQGWWSVGYTYIENIFNKCVIFSREAGKLLGEGIDYDEFREKFGGLSETYITDLSCFSWAGGTPSIYSPSGSKSYANMFFNVSYQPMNSLTIKYTKNTDVPVNIEQLDTSESAITALDDLANNETDKINRLGNDVVAISQCTGLYSNIQPLNSIISDHVVFKRVISVGLNAYDVNYFASKDYVIKNYFTSIQTKYRAYQYASYEESVVRKEHDKVFVRVGNDYLAGDDLITCNPNAFFELFTGLINYAQYEPLEYAVPHDGGKGMNYKADLSVCTYKGDLLLSYQDFDNVSPGIHIANPEYDSDLGGIPQAWYIYSDAYYDAHTMIFTGRVDYIDKDAIYGTSADADTAITSIYYAPKVKNLFTYISEYNLPMIEIIDRGFYKDVYEIINETLQIEVYSVSDRFIFSSWLVKLSSLIKSYYTVGGIRIVKGVFEAQDEPITAPATTYLASDYIIMNTYGGTGGNYMPEFTVKWSTLNCSEITVVAQINGKWYEVAGFKKSDSSADETYFCSLNDTKTDKVFRKSDTCDLIYPDGTAMAYSSELDFATSLTRYIY